MSSHSTAKPLVGLPSASVEPDIGFLCRPIVFHLPARVVDPPSWVSHIPFAFWMIDVLRPSTLVELGTHSGNSYSAFAQAVQTVGVPTTCYAIDTWRGDPQTGFYGEDVFTEWASYHDRHFSAVSRLIRSTFDEAARQFPDGCVDLLHIDGCHTYESACADWSAWRQKLSARSVVLVHDVNVREQDFGVWRLWDEMRSQWPAFTFTHGHGLGVLGTGSELPQELRRLFSTAAERPSEVSVVRQFFAALGNRIAESFAAGEAVKGYRKNIHDIDVARSAVEASAAALSRTVEERGARLDTLSATLANRDSRLQAVLNELRSRGKETRRLSVEASQCAARLDALSAAVATWNVTAASQETAVVQPDGVTRRRDDVDSLPAAVARLERALQDASAEHAALSRQAAANESELTQLRSTLHDAVADADERVAAATTEIAAAKDQIGALSLDRGRDRCNAVALALELDAIHQTRLWKRTRSLHTLALLLDAVKPRPGASPRRYRFIAALLMRPTTLIAAYQILEHRLFAEEFYRRRYPDVARSHLPPLVHFVLYGARERRDPHPLFDTNWYLGSTPPIARHVANALLDYVRHGAVEGRDPHPLFSTAHYGRSTGVAQGSENPLTHYLTVGRYKGLTPHPLFDPGYYLSHNGDVADAGLEPLTHFVEHGRHERRLPSALSGAATSDDHRLAGIVPPWLTRGTEPDVCAGPIDAYDGWLAVNEWNGKHALRLRDRLAAAAPLPRISIVTPVFRPDRSLFEQTVTSVARQVHTEWEWCLADDASGDPALAARLDQLAAEDSRIRLTTRSVNGHISRASNSAAALATGDFLAFLDHDDLLSPDAIGEVALYLGEHPDVDVLYSDDDKIDASGRRFAPQFKPDWSPESLLSQMYLAHLLVVRRSLFDRIGGFRSGFEGSQDHDLALRATELAREVGHLPLVLYHWRAAAGSTAMSGDAKAYSFEAGLRAVDEALTRRHVIATSERPAWAVSAGASLIRHRFPDAGPSVAVLIITRNQQTLLRRCLTSIALTSYQNYEIVVVDDGSDEPETVEFLNALSCRVIRAPGARAGFNFAALCNHAARNVAAEYLLFLNDDTEVRSPSWLSQMVGFAQLPGVGAVGARLLFSNGTVQHAGVLHGFNQGSLAHAFRGLPADNPGYLAAARVCRNYGAVTAACMLTPRALFLDAGGFDEATFPASFNDVDYCYRIGDKGYRCVYAAEAELMHHEGSSRGVGSSSEEIARFRARYRHRSEPYYNPNLSRDTERFEVRPVRLARGPRRRVRAAMFGHALDLTGAPMCQLELTAALRDRESIDPHVVVARDGPLRARYEARGIPVTVLAAVDRAESIDEYETALAAIQAEMRDTEVVYANTLGMFAVIDAARRQGLPSLWNIRESEPWRTCFADRVSEIAETALGCFAHPYRIVFVSNASRASFEALNTTLNFAVVHDGLHLGEWSARLRQEPRIEARRALSLGGADVAVLLLGTVCERKGQHDLVKALARLDPNRCGHLRCFIVGDRPSPYSDELARLVNRLPATVRARVQVVPETADVVGYYRAADVFVCTSRVESYPRVTLEAMACGLPIVSTPVFGLSEQLREGVNTIFYPPGEIATLAAALDRLTSDASTRERMGDQSGAVLAGLKSFDEMVDDYATLLREAAQC